MPADDGFSVSLLHCDGSDASTTITDETGKTWTARGNAQIDTGQSVFGGASLQFDNSGDSADTPDSADWQLDGGSNSNEWTVEWRLRIPVTLGGGTMGQFSQRGTTNNRWDIFCFNNNLVFEVKSLGSTIISISNAFNPSIDTWYGLAVVKQGTTGYKMFVDGTQVGSTQTDTDTIPDFGGVLALHTFDGTASTFACWMDEIRISKGIARYTSNYTLATQPFGTLNSSGFFF
jgi:hypothetical protein